MASADVFLNVPYDHDFSEMFLAYIAGLAALGLVPRTTLEISSGERRLDRIISLIQECPYSTHDLSRVEAPRFNMPFELGLTIAWQKLLTPRHQWFVFEARRSRIERSLSDLNGMDVSIHRE